MQISLGPNHVEVDQDTHPTFPGYWKAVDSGDWEPQTLGAILDTLSTGDRYIDVGAWIGPTVLAAAAAGAEVVAFEPDPVARGRLERNLTLNPELTGRVKVHPLALGDYDGPGVIRSHVMGNSGSSLMYRGNAADEATIQVADARRVAREERFGDAILVKIDIEGGEYALVAAIATELKRGRPALLLSTHAHYLEVNFQGRGGRLRTRLVALWRHPRLVWHLRSYSNWAVADGKAWCRIGRWRAAVRLVKPTEQEFWIRA